MWVRNSAERGAHLSTTAREGCPISQEHSVTVLKSVRFITHREYVDEYWEVKVNADLDPVTGCACCQAQFTPSFHIPFHYRLWCFCLPAAYKYASANWRHLGRYLKKCMWGDSLHLVLVPERKALETWAVQSTMAILSWFPHYTHWNVFLESKDPVLELRIQPLQDVQEFCQHSITSAYYFISTWLWTFLFECLDCPTHRREQKLLLIW